MLLVLHLLNFIAQHIVRACFSVVSVLVLPCKRLNLLEWRLVPHDALFTSEIMEKKKGKEKEQKRTAASLHAGTRTMLTRPGERKVTPAAAAAAKTAFDPSRCSVTEGYWAYNRSRKLLYTDQTCPFIDRQISCQRNGRPDSDYLYWDWHLDDCSLPRSATARVLSFPSVQGTNEVVIILVLPR